MIKTKALEEVLERYESELIPDDHTIEARVELAAIKERMMTEVTEATEKKELLVGMLFEARGGWIAEVVHIRVDKQGFEAVHRPGVLSKSGIQGIQDESSPVHHWPDGTAHAAFSVNEPPTYNGHPADLDMTGYEL